MSCLASNNVATSSAATTLPLPLSAATTSRSPIDSLLSGILTNFPSPSSSSLPIGAAQPESPINFFSDMLSVGIIKYVPFQEFRKQYF